MLPDLFRMTPVENCLHVTQEVTLQRDSQEVTQSSSSAISSRSARRKEMAENRCSGEEAKFQSLWIFALRLSKQNVEGMPVMSINSVS